MKTIEKTKSRSILTSCDEDGMYEIEVRSDCTPIQIRLRCGIGECLINASPGAVKEIIKMFQEAIEDYYEND